MYFCKFSPISLHCLLLCKQDHMMGGRRCNGCKFQTRHLGWIFPELSCVALLMMVFVDKFIVVFEIEIPANFYIKVHVGMLLIQMSRTQQLLLSNMEKSVSFPLFLLTTFTKNNVSIFFSDT